MKINAKDNLFGAPMLAVRNLLRRGQRYCGAAWSESLANHVLKLNAEQTRKVLDELARQGYIKKDEFYSHEQFWGNTLQGNSLPLASAAKPVTRATADKAFTEVMERVQKVNDDTYYLFKVTRVVLFGSYLKDTETVNNVNVAIRIAPKIEDIGRRTELYEQRRQESQRNFRGFMDYLGWPINEVLLFLKSKSRVISMHDCDLDEKLLETIETKVVLGEVL
jgi:predicted nucleotidyltransferase